MTLIIGANLNNYVLVAADTRVAWKHPISGEAFKDHDHKIVNCKIGLVTGSGYTEALDSVKEELLRREINHTGEIEEIVNEKAIPKIRLLNKNNPEVKNKFLVIFAITLSFKIFSGLYIGVLLAIPLDSLLLYSSTSSFWLSEGIMIIVSFTMLIL